MSGATGSKSFKEWLKYKHIRCVNNFRKQYDRREKGEIDTKEYVRITNSFNPPLMDLYKTLNGLSYFPWDDDYDEMIADAVGVNYNFHTKIMLKS